MYTCAGRNSPGSCFQGHHWKSKRHGDCGPRHELLGLGSMAFPGEKG